MAPTRLEDFNSTIPPHLGRVLWGWTLCNDCEAGKPCVTERCSGQRIPKLQRYHQFYKAAVAGYLEESSADSRVLDTHEDLFRAIATLKNKPDISKAAFYQDGFPTASCGRRAFERADLLQAATLAVRIFLMIESSPLHHYSDRLESGGLKVPWLEDVPFSQYIEQLFHRTTHRIFSFAESEGFADIKVELRATKLRKHLGVTFRATHDIRNHLSYDYRENTIDVYHHAAFLKEQLRATKNMDQSSPPIHSISLGSLPRQLVLETLDSVQAILFPLSEPKSKALLKSVTTSCSFDPELSNFEYSAIRNPGEEKTSYVYLADRLSGLYHELQNPRPRGSLERQMERKSGARYMMMATLIGVVFAVILGFLSLVVSSYQTWIAYEAWKHPVPSSSG
ncbi:hypothetical protein NLU13_7390 [Sarocladium strictum]|uniref:Uncharacterized protein n=1 Tax=Sarocladium strictum TaxID=5046 RepID=A0AA39GD93_SARSR|nr:hypothetical protein NLU13_7390 [Sarocladium strictum]